MLNAWVKNMYSLRKDGSKNSDSLSPILQKGFIAPQKAVQNYPFIHRFLTSFHTSFSTMEIARLPLLLTSFTHHPQDLLLHQRKVN